MVSESSKYCALLRTKMAYFRSPEGERLIDQQSTTACYTCLRTLKPFGPDGLPAEARRCGPGRACFEEER